MLKTIYAAYVQVKTSNLEKEPEDHLIMASYDIEEAREAGKEYFKSLTPGWRVWREIEIREYHIIEGVFKDAKRAFNAWYDAHDGFPYYEVAETFDTI